LFDKIRKEINESEVIMHKLSLPRGSINSYFKGKGIKRI